jgi:predicted MPP superfamily phosphohydrolase
LAGSVIGAAYSDYSAHVPQLEKVDLKLKGWKADGLRVGFITDIHVNDTDQMLTAHKASVMLASASPDLILFGGDCVNSEHSNGIANIRKAFEPFQKLNCPKVAILGNHDYASSSVEDVERALERSGFRVLKNQIAEFDNYRVAGYDDALFGTRDRDFNAGGAGTIALLHEPDFVDRFGVEASLQLSGHSHGGQMCLPFGIAVHTPKGSRKYRRGYYPEANSPLYVSRGVGTTGPKWRLFCPPEVTLLTLWSDRG